jgi:diguanylate cyclase (GGDEF)-like protein/PAS domain S-box-containing protein
MTRKKQAVDLTARRYQTALAGQVYGLVMVSEDDRVEFANQTFCDTFGLSTSPSDLVGLTSAELLELIGPAYADPAGTLVRVRDVLAAGRHHIGDEVQMRDGRVLLVDFSPIVVDGKPSGRVWQVRDITARKQAEAALKKSEEQVRLLLNSTAEAIYGINLEGNCTFANPSCLGMLGYTDTEQLLGQNMHRLIHHSYPDGRPMPVEVCKIYQAFREGNGVRVDDEVLWRADGTSFPVEYRSHPQIAGGEVTGAVVTFSDITARKQAEEAVLHLATHDALTDLPSLRLAMDRLAMALGQARRHRTAAAVMFIDLDGFKAVNDSLGHDAGDRVLKQVALRMRTCLRETDTVARVGGDEFLIIAAELNGSADAVRIAEKVIRVVSQPVITGRDQKAVVGASVGIALYPDNGADVDQLIKLADEAMYRVKNAGKNAFVFADPAKG